MEIPRNPTAGLWLTTFSTSSDCRIGNFTEIVFEWNFIFKPPKLTIEQRLKTMKEMREEETEILQGI